MTYTLSYLTGKSGKNYRHFLEEKPTPTFVFQWYRKHRLSLKLKGMLIFTKYTG